MTSPAAKRFPGVRRVFRRLRTRFRRLSGTHPADAPVTKIVAMALVKNEQDTIELFLRHNRRFVDAIILLDHMSADRTCEIVLACARELGGIFLADVPVFAFRQADFMTSALHRVQTAFFADVVCLLDADEFIGCRDRAEFERLLDTIPPGDCLEIPWQTFLPDPATPPETDPFLRMNCRRKAELPPESKSFVRLHGQVDPYLKVGQGNHWLWSIDGEQLPRHRRDGVVLKHFPVRSMDQLRTKSIVGWLANLARNRNAFRDLSSWQRRRVFDLVLGGDMGDAQALLAHEAMTYAQTGAPENFSDNAVAEPHGIAPERQFSDGSYGDPVRLIAAAWASSLAQQGQAGLGKATVADQIAAAAAALGRAGPAVDAGLDVTPLRHLTAAMQPRSIIEFGCRDGAALHMMQAWSGATGFGVDSCHPDQTILPAERFMQSDLRSGLDAGRPFDLAVCINLSEAFTADEQGTLFDTLARHAERAILFAAAEAWQEPGDGAEARAMALALEEFRRRGWEPDLIETLGLRSLCASLRLRRDLVLLKPSATDAGLAAARELVRIAGYPFRRRREGPGVREAAMLDPIPHPSVGYGARLLQDRSTNRPGHAP